MKIRVGKDLCCGAQRCVEVAPDVYRLDAAGYNASDGEQVPPDRQAQARRGALACPERAISFEEE